MEKLLKSIKSIMAHIKTGNISLNTALINETLNISIIKIGQIVKFKIVPIGSGNKILIM